MGYSGLEDGDSACLQWHHYHVHPEGPYSVVEIAAASFACDSTVSEVPPILCAKSGMFSPRGNPYTLPTHSVACMFSC